MVITHCDFCGKVIEYVPADFKRKKHHFCSLDCKAKWQQQHLKGPNNPNFDSKLVVCQICGKKFYTPKSRAATRRYCSKKCHNIAKHIGQERTELSTSFRSLRAYIEWRDEVKARAGYKCEICGSPDHLEAHHIISVDDAPELILDLQNGICLCRKHHYAMHRNNTATN